MISSSKVVIIASVMVLLYAGPGVEAKRARGAPHFIVNRWYEMPGYSETPYTECESGDGKIVKVEVVPCDIEDDACILPSGKESTIKIQFTPKVNATTLRAVVHGVVGGVPVPFHIPQPDACSNSGLTCPIEAGKTYDYQAQIPVRKSYPRLSVKVKWELIDENKKDVVCVVIPAKIKNV